MHPAHRTLTSREIEVLRLLQKRLIGREIAKTLGISVTTVEGHRNRVLRKMKVHTTAHAIKLAIEQNILSSIEADRIDPT